MDDNVTPPTPPPEPSPASPPPLRPPPAPPVFQQPVYQRPLPQRSTGTGWKVLGISMTVLFLLAVLGLFFIGMVGGDVPLQAHHSPGPRLQETWVKDNKSENKIAVIPVEGVIMSGGAGRGDLVGTVEKALKQAEEDKRVKAVVLKVNSPGGEVLASDDIYNLIAQFQRNTTKPVVASMGSLAASGGYYVSAPCQWIVANELTITGSIGVIMHGYNFRGLMDKVGVRPEVFKSGKFKDMLSPDKREEDITAEERELVQSMVNETFDKFKSIISEGRGNAAKKNGTSADAGKALADNWQQYADGRILSGKEALRLGFVDELGNLDTAVARARKLAKIADANVIEYQPVFDLSDIFGFLGQSSKSEARTLKIDMGIDMPKLQLGRLYFLYPLALPQ
jgi:protease IV